MPDFKHIKLGDAIEIVDKTLISNSEHIENGERFIVVGKQLETAMSHAHIIIIDNNADDLAILGSELIGIKLVNDND